MLLLVICYSFVTADYYQDFVDDCNDCNTCYIHRIENYISEHPLASCLLAVKVVLSITALLVKAAYFYVGQD